MRSTDLRRVLMAALSLVAQIWPSHGFVHTLSPITTQVHTSRPQLKLQERTLIGSSTDLYYRRYSNPNHPPKTTATSSSTQLKLFPSIPWIEATDMWGNWAALTGTATISQVLGKTTRVGRLLGPPVTAMAITVALASIGILNPGGTAAAKSLQLFSLQLATPLILLGADLRDCVERCGPLLLSFGVASLATVVACLVGWLLTGRLLQAALGPKDGLAIAAALMAKNIGGGINYIAVCRSLNASPAAIAAGLCIDNIFALVYFPATSALGAGRPDVSLLKVQKKKDIAMAAMGDTNSHNDDNPESFSIQGVSTALFLSAFLLWAGERIGGMGGALPCCTILTVLLASWAPSSFLRPIQNPAHILGTTCLYLFFATAGAPGIAVAESVRTSLVPLSLFLSLLYGIHGIILTAVHKAFPNRASFVPQRLLVASSAAIGGPATAVALAQTNQWSSLEVPSLLVGNVGYAIATFCGLGYYAFFSR